MFVRDQVLFRPGSVEGELSTINHCNTHDLVGRLGIEPRPRDYEAGANRRNGPEASEPTEIHCAHHPVVSDASGGVGLVTDETWEF